MQQALAGELYNDLQDMGLLAYAETLGVMNDVGKLLKGRAEDLKPAAHLVNLPPDMAADASALIMPIPASADPGPACSMQVSGAGPQGQPMSVDQRAADTMLQGDQAATLQRQGSCSVSAVDEQAAHANRSADVAASDAAQAIARARRVMQNVTSLTRHHTRPAPGSLGGSTQQQDGPGCGASDAGATRRKSSRSSASDASASRSAAQAQAQMVVANSKGLRHFAVLVCEQVRGKGRTTYNEVADLLVAKMTADYENDGKDAPDDKTIRRRVYDALNVLMAMDIIQREKKDIIWRGLPRDLNSLGTGSAPPPSASPDHLRRLRQERLRRISDVDRKQTFLQELVEQHAALKALIARNASQRGRQSGTEIHLPFILIQTRPDATVEVKISDDMQDVQFDIYNSAIQLHDDSGVIKHMALAAAEGGERATSAPMPARTTCGGMAGVPGGVGSGLPGGSTPCTANLAPRMAMV